MRRPFLLKSKSNTAGRNSAHQTGETVPETGIYRVVHSSHRLPHEVIILKGERFPRCSKCADDVLFDLVHAAPDLYLHSVNHVYELSPEDEPRMAIQ